MTSKRCASEIASTSVRSNPPQAKRKKIDESPLAENAATVNVKGPIREHHAFSFKFDESSLLFRNEDKCGELVRKSSGYHTRLPKDLHESKTFDALSRSMIQSIGYIGQMYLRYERNLIEADVKIDKLMRVNVDLEKRALESENALQKAQEDLKTIQSEGKSTSDRLFNENFLLSSTLEEARHKIRDLIEERDLSTAIVESKSMSYFEEGRKARRNEVLKVCEEKLDGSRYYMEKFIETFNVTSLFEQVRAVAENIRSLFGKGHILSKDVVKSAEEKSHQMLEHAITLLSCWN